MPVITLSYAELHIDVKRIGADILITVCGGTKPHIGSAVLAVPRPSLTGDGHLSATSSVLNVTGHKDDVLCRYLAEKAAAKYNAVTVCTGGFHVDHITQTQIQELMEALRQTEL